MTNYDQHYRIRFTEIIVNATRRSWGWFSQPQ